MRRRTQLALAAGVAVVTALAVFAGGRQEEAPPVRMTYGVSGEDPRMFADPRFAALGLHDARVQVSWDLAVHTGPAYPGLAAERVRLARWLADAPAAGIRRVLLAIKPSRDLPGAQPGAAYGGALAALLAWIDARGAGDLVTAISPWNEPDAAPSTRADPVAAGRMYAVVRALCAVRGCRAVAGDFADRGMSAAYLAGYLRGAGAPAPRVWAWHAYEDAWDRAADPTLPRLRAFLAQLPPRDEVWLTEQGGIVRRLQPGDDGRTSQSAAAANADLAFLLDRATHLDARITRFDVYQFRGEPPPRWDSGLIAPDGATRAAYTTFRDALRR
jgi:hypothetical protein